MSTFRVNLQNIKQGGLDLDPSTHPRVLGVKETYGDLGQSFGRHNPNSGDHSLQRTIWIAGPNGAYRLRRDGEVFEDSNYFKQFAYPQASLEDAILEVVVDDGSIYSDNPDENTFPVGHELTLADAYSTDNTIDYSVDHGGPAVFLQVQNLDDTNSVIGELNGNATAVFTLLPGQTQTFEKGDLRITQLRLKSDAGTPVASILAGVQSVSRS